MDIGILRTLHSLRHGLMVACGSILLGATMLSACGGPTQPPGARVSRSDLYLALHRPVGGGPAALVGGKLVDERGCIAFETVDGIALPVWPPGTYAWEVDGTTVVADGGGRIVAREGAEAYFGGGFKSLSGIQELMDAPIPANCQLGTYLVINELRNFPGS